MADEFDLFAEKKNTNENIAKISSILAFVVIFAYILLTVIAVQGIQRKHRASYRADEISKEELADRMRETTYLKMMLSPDKVFKSIFK